MIMTTENIRDCGINTGLISARFRMGGAGDGGKRYLHRLIDDINDIVQADGTISAQNKTDWANVLAFIAVDANFDKVVKKF